MKLYHGTSDIFKIKEILPPIESGQLRESFRKKYMDKVFATPSLPSARRYARRGTEKYGGNPIVYQVYLVNGYQVNNTEFVGDKGVILSSLQ